MSPHLAQCRNTQSEHIWSAYWLKTGNQCGRLRTGHFYSIRYRYWHSSEIKLECVSWAGLTPGAHRNPVLRATSPLAVPIGSQSFLARRSLLWRCEAYINEPPDCVGAVRIVRLDFGPFIDSGKLAFWQTQQKRFGVVNRSFRSPPFFRYRFILAVGHIIRYTIKASRAEVAASDRL